MSKRAGVGSAWLAAAVVIALGGAPAVAAAPPTFVVTTTSDGSTGGCDAESCTLREAMQAANAVPLGTGSTIAFAVPGPVPVTIQPATSLPAIDRPVTIDGTTQSGYDGDPVVELDLRNSSGIVVAPAFSDGTVVLRGLVINRAQGEGVSHESGYLVLEGNYIGTDVTGTLDRGNQGPGIFMWDSDPDGATIRDNVISGNSGWALDTFASRSVYVRGNRIGTDVTGTVAIPNGAGGLEFSETYGTVIDNVISGNGGVGIELDGAEVDLAGNRIGVDATGTAPLGNAGHGVSVLDTCCGGPSRIGAAGMAPNVIGANGGDGVAIVGGSAVTVQDSRIGTDLSGTIDLGNGRAGVSVGPGGTGMPAVTIGGTRGGWANRIAFNRGDGVEIVGGVTDVPIRLNRIYGNGGLAIDLDGDGVTQNDRHDPFDADTGSNDLQNFPTLRSVTASGGTTTVRGDLRSTPSTTFDVDVFTNPSCDRSGRGEAERALGTVRVTTDAVGRGVVTVTFTKPSSAGHVATATATPVVEEGQRSPTSEVSVCVAVTAG